MKKAYFQYYETFEKIVQKFKTTEAQNAFRQKIIEYGLFEKEPELNELEEMVWDVVKDMIDSQMHRRKVNAENRNGKVKESAVKEEPEQKETVNEPAPVEKKEPRRFIKPTLEEITDYCKERNNGISAQNFFDFYESKGWKIGSQSMKDWRAAIRTWEQRRTVPDYSTPRRSLPEDRQML